MSGAYAVDPKRWSAMTIFEQMGNIYSEVGRSLKAKERGEADDLRQAVTRAIDLFDVTAGSLVSQGSPKSKEVLRAKEEFLSVIYGPASAEKARSLDRYFMQFAVAARINR